MPLLSVNDLRTYFHTRTSIFRAVDGVNFSLDRGEILCIVGESGSGKSVTCYSLMGLIPTPPGRIESGTSMFDGVDLLNCTPAQARSIRGKRVSMIFQDPMTSLNPYLRVSEPLIEPLLIHEDITKADALKRALEMLDAVGINDAANRIHYYSSRILWRDATTRNDRHGADHQARAPHRRRAHDRARRHRAGPNPRANQKDAAGYRYGCGLYHA